MKHDIDHRQVRWKLQRVSYIVSKRQELSSTNGLKWDRSFHPPSKNSAFSSLLTTELNQTLLHGMGKPR